MISGASHCFTSGQGLFVLSLWSSYFPILLWACVRGTDRFICLSFAQVNLGFTVATWWICFSVTGVSMALWVFPYMFLVAVVPFSGIYFELLSVLWLCVYIQMTKGQWKWGIDMRVQMFAGLGPVLVTEGMISDLLHWSNSKLHRRFFWILVMNNCLSLIASTILMP